MGRKRVAWRRVLGRRGGTETGWYGRPACLFDGQDARITLGRVAINVVQGDDWGAHAARTLRARNARLHSELIMRLPACPSMLAQSDFTTVGWLLIVATGIALAILVLTHLIGPKRRGPVKDATYESGMEPIGDTRRRFNVRFYLIAVLFLIFDVEIVFLYPWAILFPRLRGPEHQEWAQPLLDAGYTPAYLLGAIGVFFALLLVGFIYEWRRGVFRWN